ncbi:Inositol 2-dehydrogenase/D-chiro-inositol 3-dehydrogenase [subsurface metagenome]
MKQKIKIGMIGHKFMGKAHNHAYTDLSIFFEPPLQPIKQILCGKGDDLEETAKRWGWKEWTDSWEEVVSREDINLVDIAAPSTIHRDIAIAAARAGKHIICEKPLALSVEDARDMLSEAEKAGVKHTVGFNYRKVPAIKLARRLIEEGYIGRIFHFRGIYSQDWLVNPNFPLAWRLRKKDAGGGSSWDLGAHVIDLARYLIGDLEELSAMQTTFIKERPIAVKEDGLVAIAGKEKKESRCG